MEARQGSMLATSSLRSSLQRTELSQFRLRTEKSAHFLRAVSVKLYLTL